MRTAFSEYFPLNEAELRRLWDTGLIVLDANVVLRFYRYKKEIVDNVLGNLEGLRERLWLPNQVGWEYNKIRLLKIREA